MIHRGYTEVCERTPEDVLTAQPTVYKSKVTLSYTKRHPHPNPDNLGFRRLKRRQAINKTGVWIFCNSAIKTDPVRVSVPKCKRWNHCIRARFETHQADSVKKKKKGKKGRWIHRPRGSQNHGLNGVEWKRLSKQQLYAGEQPWWRSQGTPSSQENTKVSNERVIG